MALPLTSVPVATTLVPSLNVTVPPLGLVALAVSVTVAVAFLVFQYPADVGLSASDVVVASVLTPTTSPREPLALR